MKNYRGAQWRFNSPPTLTHQTRGNTFLRYYLRCYLNKCNFCPFWINLCCFSWENILMRGLTGSKVGWARISRWWIPTLWVVHLAKRWLTQYWQIWSLSDTANTEISITKHTVQHINKTVCSLCSISNSGVGCYCIQWHCSFSSGSRDPTLYAP